MHKVLLLLGMLLNGPLHGYQMHRIVRAHGELYADLKKANLYYLLERLAHDGYLTMEVEAGTRGVRGERLIYSLTTSGLAHFHELLRATLLSYAPIHTGIETAIVFLAYLPREDGVALLQQRRATIQQRRAQMVADTGQSNPATPLVAIASDHLLSLIDAELAWIDRSLVYLDQIGWTKEAQAASTPGQMQHPAKQNRPDAQTD